MIVTMFETLEDYTTVLGHDREAKGKLHLGLGDELRRLRLQEEWTQEEMAYHAGIHIATISRIELGKGNPTLETIRKLADALGVDVRLVEST